MRTLAVGLLTFVGFACGWLVSLLPAVAQEGKPAANAEAKATAAKEAADNQEPAAQENFIRIHRNDKGTPLTMDTGIARYQAAAGKNKGAIVDLIGAVHIGEKSYYDALNKKFEDYDVLLYELVAPPNTRIPKGAKGSSGHPIAAMQTGMKSMLGLEHQLECVDYTKANFVHADMSPDEFAKSMKDKGESFAQMIFRAMGAGMAQQATGKQSGDLEMLAALFSNNRAQKLRLAMSSQFEDLDSQTIIFDGPDGSTILTERNRKAFEVLAKELAAGKKKIGVFYGAAHLPDMEKKLADDFGMQRTELTWLPAWSLTSTPLPAVDEEKPAEKKEEKKKS
ncbi:hypothetical protein ETAA8_03010 [Anatilimnocola aggregata]|uniref:Uncharacterized protein n=1 Tax=Anatilimnocola aggregata TaxID=2528021 RepID=A0A517Y4R5_9BACT|nr:hypothetical protein [Anatilimnocola aggregata]QDU25238.1 hypothetical protein ETAA8_03010 [Anatilimnocola aggregata]